MKPLRFIKYFRLILLPVTYLIIEEIGYVQMHYSMTSLKIIIHPLQIFKIHICIHYTQYSTKGFNWKKIALKRNIHGCMVMLNTGSAVKCSILSHFWQKLTKKTQFGHLILVIGILATI